MSLRDPRALVPVRPRDDARRWRATIGSLGRHRPLEDEPSLSSSWSLECTVRRRTVLRRGQDAVPDRRAHLGGANQMRSGVVEDDLRARGRRPPSRCARRGGCRAGQAAELDVGLDGDQPYACTSGSRAAPTPRSAPLARNREVVALEQPGDGGRAREAEDLGEVEARKPLVEAHLRPVGIDDLIGLLQLSRGSFPRSLFRGGCGILAGCRGVSNPGSSGHVALREPENLARLPARRSRLGRRARGRRARPRAGR